MGGLQQRDVIGNICRTAALFSLISLVAIGLLVSPAARKAEPLWYTAIYGCLWVQATALAAVLYLHRSKKKAKTRKGEP